MSTRLFIAVEVDDHVRELAGRIRDALLASHGRTAAGALRWVETSRLHLTLRFIGNVDDDLAGRIVAACRGELDVPPFAMRFASPDWLPGPSRPRVLMLPVADGGDALGALARAVGARLPHDAPPEEPRAYRPHLTLARVRPDRGRDGARLARDISIDLPSHDASCPVTHAVLFESHLSPRGPDYRERARLLLASSRQ